MLNTDPDFHLRLTTYRRKAADGTITLEEMREAVKLMRGGRVAAAAQAKTSSSRKKAAPADSGVLLAELEGL